MPKRARVALAGSMRGRARKSSAVPSASFAKTALATTVTDSHSNLCDPPIAVDHMFASCSARQQGHPRLPRVRRRHKLPHNPNDARHGTWPRPIFRHRAILLFATRGQGLQAEETRAACGLGERSLASGQGELQRISNHDVSVPGSTLTSCAPSALQVKIAWSFCMPI